jgi:hypothetical protein
MFFGTFFTISDFRGPVSIIYACQTTYTVLEYYSGSVVCICISLACLSSFILRTVRRNWRVLYYYQWRSLIYIIHSLVVFVTIIVDRYYIGSHLFDKGNLYIWPSCVAANARNPDPPCEYVPLNLFGYTIYLLTLLYTWPFACFYMYFTSEYTRLWWTHLIFQRKLITQISQLSQISQMSRSQKNSNE